MIFPRRVFLALVLFAPTLTGILAAQDQAVDSLAALEKARDTYDQALDQARDRLLAKIEKRIEEATSAGRLDAVDQFNAQKGDFIARGILPQAPGLQPEVRAYNSARKTAGRAPCGGVSRCRAGADQGRADSTTRRRFRKSACSLKPR